MYTANDFRIAGMAERKKFLAKQRTKNARLMISHKANIAHIKATVVPDLRELWLESDPEPF